MTFRSLERKSGGLSLMHYPLSCPVERAAVSEESDGLSSSFVSGTSCLEQFGKIKQMGAFAKKKRLDSSADSEEGTLLTRVLKLRPHGHLRVSQ